MYNSHLFQCCQQLRELLPLSYSQRDWAITQIKIALLIIVFDLLERRSTKPLIKVCSVEAGHNVQWAFLTRVVIKTMSWSLHDFYSLPHFSWFLWRWNKIPMAFLQIRSVEGFFSGVKGTVRLLGLGIFVEIASALMWVLLWHSLSQMWS